MSSREMVRDLAAILNNACRLVSFEETQVCLSKCVGILYRPMGLLPDAYNCALRICRECRGRFPRHRLQRKPLVSDPGMHHGTCVTHVPWCMSGSLTRGGGKNFPGIPGACATHNFAYLERGPCRWNRNGWKNFIHGGQECVQIYMFATSLAAQQAKVPSGMVLCKCFVQSFVSSKATVKLHEQQILEILYPKQALHAVLECHDCEKTTWNV